MSFEKFTRRDWTVGGVALALVIGLLFGPWFHFSAHAGSFSPSANLSATAAPDGLLGVVAVIAVLAVILDLAFERLAPQAQVPAIGGSRTTTRLVLALTAGLFVALKFFVNVQFSLFGSQAGAGGPPQQPVAGELITGGVHGGPSSTRGSRGMASAGEPTVDDVVPAGASEVPVTGALAGRGCAACGDRRSGRRLSRDDDHRPDRRERRDATPARPPPLTAVPASDPTSGRQRARRGSEPSPRRGLCTPTRERPWNRGGSRRQSTTQQGALAP